MPIQPSPNAGTSMACFPEPNVLLLEFWSALLFDLPAISLSPATEENVEVLNNAAPANAPVLRKFLRLLFSMSDMFM